VKTYVVNSWRYPDLVDVSIMRPSIWGNPFRIGRDGSRQDVLVKYEAYARARIREDPVFRAQVRSLYGQVLGCCCKPLACHGDVLVILANELHEEGA
jgi:hypothetical protein